MCAHVRGVGSGGPMKMQAQLVRALTEYLYTKSQVRS
jgi:hypothetical protein